MKRKNLILPMIALFVGVFSFSGCSTQKNYNMSYEQAVSILENQSKEMIDILFGFKSQEKDVNLFTKIDMDALNLDLNLLSQTKIDYDSRMEDVSLEFDADVKVPESEIDLITSWVLNYSLIWDDIYLKLSKFSLKWPSAKELAMVTMVVNSMKWQRFKLSMSGSTVSKAFDLYDLYYKKLWDMADKASEGVINEGDEVYNWMFDEYKWYNAWKYSVDEEKFNEMLHIYVDAMNEFYSWLFTQYSENLWVTNEEMWFVDFNTIFSGITYENLRGYFIIVWKNDVVETMENAHINIDGTWIICNYFYWKDWLYFEAKTDDGEDFMSIALKRHWRTFDIEANLLSMLLAKWNIKFNKASKKAWIDADFDLIISVDIDAEDLVTSEEELQDAKNINVKVPLKWNYKLKSIDNFSLQEPDEYIDLMDMFGDYLWSAETEEELYNEELISNNE